MTGEEIDMSSSESESQNRKKERVQLDFTSEALMRLDDIKAKTEATNRAEVIRQALRLYEWFINEVDADYTIQVLGKDEKEVIAKFKALLLRART